MRRTAGSCARTLPARRHSARGGGWRGRLPELARAASAQGDPRPSRPPPPSSTAASAASKRRASVRRRPVTARPRERSRACCRTSSRRAGLFRRQRTADSSSRMLAARRRSARTAGCRGRLSEHGRGAVVRAGRRPLRPPRRAARQRARPVTGDRACAACAAGSVRAARTRPGCYAGLSANASRGLNNLHR
jgi:hypothetical protein